jgi:hypothetical protein
MKPIFPVLALLLASVAASAQQPAPPPTPSTTWTAPPGSTITVDRRSGRISINLPFQPTDGSREQALHFAVWAVHPYAGSGPFPATREEPASGSPAKLRMR